MKKRIFGFLEVLIGRGILKITYNGCAITNEVHEMNERFEFQQYVIEAFKTIYAEIEDINRRVAELKVAQ
ncbi:MAG: hypothetical protein ACW98F_14115 [Candidatus Hodarchaeales archaeon]